MLSRGAYPVSYQGQNRIRSIYTRVRSSNIPSSSPSSPSCVDGVDVCRAKADLWPDSKSAVCASPLPLRPTEPVVRPPAPRPPLPRLIASLGATHVCGTPLTLPSAVGTHIHSQQGVHMLSLDLHTTACSLALSSTISVHKVQLQISG